ncbi:uncharacterized protein LOC120842813 isoform X2 [Ixodes scapularis]|uniref:uncharacterized protein LOC120842813 isoform X2 n=1 Tax=Ixodes scapularis TaxID=6945 RepID=UPI001C39080F|nr:uncharacterized protein LOC120842813 isoform X2 [Ixodes scapularis]
MAAHIGADAKDAKSRERTAMQEDTGSNARCFFAQFSGVSIKTRVRLLKYGTKILLLKFNLGQPVSNLYEVDFPTTCDGTGDARLLFRGILDCKSGIKEVYAVDQLILVVTQGGLYTVPLDVGSESWSGCLIPNVRAVCPNPSGGFVAAVEGGPLSWDLRLNGESPALCRVACSRQMYTGTGASDSGPVLRCVSVHRESQQIKGGFRRDSFGALFGGSTESPVLLAGLPDGRVLWTPVRQRCHGGAHLLCDLGQPVAAIGSWCPDNAGAELVLVGRSGLILARHGQRWLRAWTPQGLEAAEEFCIDSLVIQWLYGSVPWQAKLKLATTEPPQLLLDCGPLPVGEAVSAQLTTNSASHATSGLLLLDRGGGLRLLRSPPRPTLCTKTLDLGPLAEARSALARSQARLAQLRRMRDQVCTDPAVTVTRRLPEGLLVAEFPSLSGVVPGWWHCASFEQGGRTLCCCTIPGSAAGQGSVVVPDSGRACTLTRLALLLSPETPSGKPLAAVLRPSLLPAMAPPNATPCKAALLSMASTWVPGNAGDAGSGQRLASRLDLGPWPAVLLPAGSGVCILELELPGAKCKPGARGLALLNLLDLVCRRGGEPPEKANSGSGSLERSVRVACVDLERTLTESGPLEAYRSWRSSLGTALPVA